MKNGYGDEYYYEQIGENEYRFVMEGKSLEYGRVGGKEGQNEIDMNDLGFFDPSGGPFVGIGSSIYYDEIKGAEKQPPLKVAHIRSDGDSYVVEVE